MIHEEIKYDELDDQSSKMSLICLFLQKVT